MLKLDIVDLQTSVIPQTKPNDSFVVKILITYQNNLLFLFPLVKYDKTLQ